MADQSNFFYSNLFVAIITFVVGTFAFYLYHRQKSDSKRRLAKIILLEIENAQSQLQEAKKQVLQSPDDPLPEHLYVMPADTWSKNKHLFIEDFKTSEWNAINQFYGICQLFDEAIRHNDSRFAEQEKEVRRNVQQVTYKYTIEYNDKILAARTDEEKDAVMKEFLKKRDNAVSVLVDGRYMYFWTPAKQNQVVKGCLENVDTDLSLSIVGQKFQRLSKNKLL